MKRLLVLVFAAVLLAGCSTGDDAVVQGSDYQFVSPGGKTKIFYNGKDRKQLPDLQGEALMQQGKQLKLSDFAGKVTVINIWGSWCGPCRAESPDLQRVFATGKAQVFGIDVRDPQRQSAQDFVRSNGIKYPSIYDPPGRSLLRLRNYPAATVPSTIVVDKHRRVAAVYLEALRASDLTPLITKLDAE